MSEMKLSLDEIRGLMDTFVQSGLTAFTLKDGDFELSFGAEKKDAPVVMMPSAAAPAAVPAAVSTEPAAAAEPVLSGNVVKSPIVGTFYAAASPDKPPYVSVGKAVEEGDVLFIIESMKLMNEVTSEFTGTVEKILVENGQPVEYGQPILIIK
jgi:acetyl-CoA carboxylase biotin carboxyl carrier protein